MERQNQPFYRVTLGRIGVAAWENLNDEGKRYFKVEISLSKKSRNGKLAYDSVAFFDLSQMVNAREGLDDAIREVKRQSYRRFREDRVNPPAPTQPVAPAPPVSAPANGFDEDIPF